MNRFHLLIFPQSVYAALLADINVDILSETSESCAIVGCR